MPVRRSGRRAPVHSGTSPSVDPVLTIDQATYDAIVAHAKRDHPDEACGIVAGPEGSDRAERLVEMVNAAGSPTFYEFDSTDLLALYKEMEPTTRSRSSSTTRTPPPRPTRAAPTSAWRASRTPTTCWSAPASTGITTARWSSGRIRIVDGEVTEEEVAVVARAPTRSTPTQPRRPRWPSRSGSPPSCAPTPATRRPSQAERRQPERADRRPRGQPPRPQGPADRGRRPAPLRQRLRQRRGRALHRRARGRRSPTATRSSCCPPSPAADRHAGPRRRSVVPSCSSTARTSTPPSATRPAPAAPAARGAARAGSGSRRTPRRSGASRSPGCSSSTPPTASCRSSFVQALLAMDYRPVPLAGARRREGRRHRHPAHPRGAASATRTPTCCCAATTATSPPQIEALLDGDRQVGLIALPRVRQRPVHRARHPAPRPRGRRRGVQRRRCPRVRIISLDEFDPEHFLR